MAEQEEGNDMTARYFQTAAEAVAEGFAEFNRNPHLAVDVPDGNFTITCKTSEGKRITFAFLAYESGGKPPQAVDIAYHSGERALNCNRDMTPVFDVIGFGSTPGEKGKLGKHHDFDTRTMSKAAGESRKVSIACVLMDGKEDA
jgi:hypothetical protein